MATRTITQGRYYNANGVGICIAASFTGRIDWAAYIGADNGYSEEACIEWTIRNGVKLSEADARHFFPDIDMRYRH